MSTYIGIDPGAGGGLAVIFGGDHSCLEVISTSMLGTERDIWEWLTQVGKGGCAVIEKVSGYIGVSTPGSAMFKFGVSYGGLRMALIAAGIQFDEITPQVWQKSLGIPSRKKTESRVQWKNRLKAKAQQLFPTEVITLATADALLIAEYCRRRWEGKLNA